MNQIFLTARTSRKAGNDNESALKFFKMAPTAKAEQKKSDQKNATKKEKDSKKKEDEPEMVNYLICFIFRESFVVWTRC